MFAPGDWWPLGHGILLYIFVCQLVPNRFQACQYVHERELIPLRLIDEYGRRYMVS